MKNDCHLRKTAFAFLVSKQFHIGFQPLFQLGFNENMFGLAI